MRSYTVTFGAKRARKVVCTSSGYTWFKRRAHRIDRREWHAYLLQYGALGGDETAERHLGIPKLDFCDVA